MGAMFIGQQFLQNVLGYSTLDAGLAILPAAFLMVLVAPRSAKLVEARGARFTLLLGYVFCLLGFLAMLLLWKEDIAYWKVGLGYAFIGIGVGFAGTPASHSLTGSVPVKRAGMASGTADLQRDLGGAIMQSILGALLTAGYAAAAGAAIASSRESAKVSDNVEGELTKSFSSAADLAGQYPRHANRSSPRPRPPSCRATPGPTAPASSRSCSAPRSSSSPSRKRDEEQRAAGPVRHRRHLASPFRCALCTSGAHKAHRNGEGGSRRLRRCGGGCRLGPSSLSARHDAARR